MERIEPRVNDLERSQSLLQAELHQMNKTLSKIEISVEKQNEIATDIRLLRSEFQSFSNIEEGKFKRINIRIEKLESAQSRLGWMVVTAVVIALLSQVLIKG